MQNKLQELTEKLYSEGLSKGKADAEELIANAKKEAEEIVAKAKEEYIRILENAKRDSNDFRVKIENEIRMVSRQTLAAVKQNIEEVVITRAIEDSVKESVNSKEFLGSLIKSAVASFNPANNDAVTLEILLPESKKNELDSFIKKDILAQLNSGIDLQYDKKIQSGFKIGPKGEGFHISFTDKDFQGLISQYLKPKTREFLFSE
jgi:V/A-type H+/Na+-transporting ATPase subunit E